MRKMKYLCPTLAFLWIVGCDDAKDGDGDSGESSANPHGDSSTGASAGASSADSSSGDSTTGNDSGDGTGTTESSADSTESTTADSDGGICGAECSLFAQDCGSDDLRCTSVACEPDNQPINAWDSAVCMAQGVRTVGESCTAAHLGTPQMHCERGAMCFNGVCVPMCIGTLDDPACEDPAFECLAYETILATCLKRCDPLAPDCPNGTNDVCSAWGPHFVCTPKPENKTVHAGPREPCECSNCCPNGYHCTDSTFVDSADCEGEDWCCAQLCDYSEDGTCESEAESCSAFSMDPLPEWEHVGLCAKPESVSANPGAVPSIPTLRQ